MLAAGVASHVQRKVKGMIPVNNEQAGGCCRPNNMQVKSTTLLRPQPPPSFTCCFFFLHFFLRDELFFLTLLALFSSCCPFTFHFSFFNLLSRLRFLRRDPRALQVPLFIRYAHGFCQSVSYTFPLSMSFVSQLLGSDRKSFKVTCYLLPSSHNELAFGFASLFSLTQPSLELFSMSLQLNAQIQFSDD